MFELEVKEENPDNPTLVDSQQLDHLNDQANNSFVLSFQYDNPSGSKLKDKEFIETELISGRKIQEEKNDKTSLDLDENMLEQVFAVSISPSTDKLTPEQATHNMNLYQRIREKTTEHKKLINDTKALFDQADKNQDQSLDFDEWTKFISLVVEQASKLGFHVLSSQDLVSKHKTWFMGNSESLQERRLTWQEMYVD